MNIGEISKPTVDRTQIKKKFDVKSSELIAPSKKVSDLIELSEESRHKYEEESDGEHSSRSSGSKDKGEHTLSKQKRSIDIEV